MQGIQEKAKGSLTAEFRERQIERWQIMATFALPKRANRLPAFDRAAGGVLKWKKETKKEILWVKKLC